MAKLFTKAERKDVVLRMQLEGPQGSGKTYTGLTLSSYFAERLKSRLAVIDTENRSSALYDRWHDFDMCALRTHEEIKDADGKIRLRPIKDPFHPDKYVALLEGAVGESYRMVMIDSVSPFWAGAGGILELVDRETGQSKSGNKWAAWANGTKLYNKVMASLIYYPGFILTTARSKVETAQQEDGNGKKRVVKLGMQAIQRDGIQYEFDIIGEMDEKHGMLITKSRFPSLADQYFEKPGRELAEAIWEAMYGDLNEAAPELDPSRYTSLRDDAANKANEKIPQQQPRQQSQPQSSEPPTSSTPDENKEATSQQLMVIEKLSVKAKLSPEDAKKLAIFKKLTNKTWADAARWIDVLSKAPSGNGSKAKPDEKPTEPEATIPANGADVQDEEDPIIGDIKAREHSLVEMGVMTKEEVVKGRLTFGSSTIVGMPGEQRKAYLAELDGQLDAVINK